MTATPTLDDQIDLLAQHDDIELAELGDSDEQGAWTWTIPVTIAISKLTCPTTKCTSQC